MSMKQNRVVGKGETFTAYLRYKNADGSPFNLTGCTASILVRKTTGETIGVYPAATGDSVGTIDVVVSDEVTATWPVGKLAYLIELTKADGTEKWLLYGSLTVLDGLVV